MTFSVISASIEWLEKHQEQVLEAAENEIAERKRIEEEIANVRMSKVCETNCDFHFHDLIVEKAYWNKSYSGEFHGLAARVRCEATGQKEEGRHV